MDSKLRILAIVTVNEVHCPVKSSRIPGSNRYRQPTNASIG